MATPGRLADHIENNSTFTLGKLKYLVLDEADRLLEGENFRFKKMQACKCASLLWLIIQDTSARIISCFVFGRFALVVCWLAVALMLVGDRSWKSPIFSSGHLHSFRKL